MHYTFNASGQDYTSVTMEFEAEVWQDVCKEFLLFLRAQGYIFSEIEVAEFFADESQNMHNLMCNVCCGGE